MKAVFAILTVFCLAFAQRGPVRGRQRVGQYHSNYRGGNVADKSADGDNLAGAQNPPYICCWAAQGQYVTFSFTVSGGSTTLALRYSAGHGAITRKIELDGATLVADQTFPGTPNWSTWAR